MSKQFGHSDWSSPVKTERSPSAPMNLTQAAEFAVSVLHELLDHADMGPSVQTQAIHAIDYLETALATQPTASNAESPSGDERWAAWVAGMVGCYLGFDVDDKRNTAIAGIIQRRLWGLPGRATRPTASNAGELEAKPCLVSGTCKHGNWCSDVYCQEHCKFVKELDQLDALAELCEEATGGWDLPPTAVYRLGKLARKVSAALASKPPAEEQKPVGYMSAKQLPLIADPGAEGGVYIPMRKTPAGLLTLALYTAPQPEQVAQDSARLDWLEQHDGRYYNMDLIASTVGTGFNVGFINRRTSFPRLREAIDAARARGEGKP